MVKSRPAGLVLLLAGLALAAAAQTSSPTPLFPARGVSAEAVRQGGLGSCYFHASIAALAHQDPKLLASRVENAPGGAYLVHFAAGPSETVRPADVAFARSSGYDRSDGLWVAVLLRGYSQRVLRQALVRALSESSLPAMLKPQAQNWISSSDLTLLAYDRAIRAVVVQDGTISPARLQAEFRTQLAQVPLPDAARSLLEQALLSQGAFDAVAATIRDNGELFGAYRAAGNGGLPALVFQAFAGAATGYQDLAPAALLLRLAAGALHGRAMVVGTGSQSIAELRAAGANVPASAGEWYFPLHAYTVMSVNPISVTVRNPWGAHPDETQGMITVSTLEFQTYFRSLFVQEPPSQ